MDIDAGNALVRAIAPIARATSRPGAEVELGGFGGLFDLRATGYADPVLVAATDGVGTKLKVAIDVDRHDTVGIDLVAMCVNDLVVQGAEPLFFLDYVATGALDVAQGTQIVQGIADGCRLAGTALIGGETAEMPGMYASGHYDLAGFAVGAVERNAILPRTDVREGDVLIGLESSGLHSNGFSLARRVIDNCGFGYGTPCPVADERSVGDILLEPTRIYVKPLLRIIRETGAVKALAHITGGGLPENLPRVVADPKLACEIDLSAWSLPPLFDWLSNLGGIAEDEMLRTFNCGIGMVVVADEREAETVVDLLSAEGEAARIIGRMTPREGEEPVVFRGRLAAA